MINEKKVRNSSYKQCAQNHFPTDKDLVHEKAVQCVWPVLRAERCQMCTESAGNCLSNFQAQRSAKKGEYHNCRLNNVTHFRYSTTAMLAYNS